MMFLTKIRERQFAKKWGGAYNLSRAVLAGVLAAGCLMPGFAEAAYLATSVDTNLIDISGNTATITEDIRIEDISGYNSGEIFWVPGDDEEDCTINVKGVNSAEPLTITPAIWIKGGYVLDGNVKSNTVDISNVKFVYDSYIFGGYTESAGTAEGNSVSISGGEFNRPTVVQGGYSESGTAIENSVIISDSNFNGYVAGGSASGTAEGNSVIISDSNFKGDVAGGYSNSGAAVFSSGDLGSNGTVPDNTVTGNTVTIKDTTFTSTSNIYGGYTSGNVAVTGNEVTISGNTTFASESTSKIYGGYSVDGQANKNIVSISGDDTFNAEVYGGRGATKAEGNSVSISGNGTFESAVFGGYSGSGEANNNKVIISGGEFHGRVYGGYADSNSGTAKTDNNEVILVGEHATYPLSAEQTINGGNIVITGAVYGGFASGGTPSGNKLHVYGSNTKVGDIRFFDEFHFFIDNQMRFGETMLTINGVNGVSNVYIRNEKLAVTVSGKPNPSVTNTTDNTITLVDCLNGTIGGFVNGDPVDVKIGATLSGNGSVALTDDEKKLVLTLNVEANENGKSLVETRAAAAFVVNNMSDFMMGTGMEQAKAAAGGVTPIDEGKLTPFAAVGGSNMRYTTGSYVDVNGWNGAVGFAKQADKLLFGVAVEHGRGNYDSYLDNGVHASGDIKSTGGVIFGEYKLDNGVHYDAALRAGRVKSDYSSTATSYDESSAYYGFSLGGGKELTVSDKATVDVYGRYYFSHTNGSDVSIATGEEIDFDAVNSHRVRIGGRYTTTLTEKSKAYAGLAWQYEFGGDAKAAINGYSAPTPSLQGHSAIVEAGYKLNAGKNLTLDFNLNGAMGKQRGIGGGIGAQWLF